MGTKQYDNYADLITFTRASKGTSLRPISYGPELITNGTFDSDLSGWTENTSGVVTWSDGVALVGDGNEVTNTFFTQNIPAVSGKTYEIKVGVNLLSGLGVRILLNNINQGGGAYFNSDQTFYYTATSSTIELEIYRFRTHDGQVEIDNISVKEVLFDQPDGTLTLFNHPDDIPRIDYDANGNRKGLLIEEQRTNLVTYSQDFTNAAWTKGSGAADLALNATGPDGEANSAATLIDTGAGGTGSDVEVFDTITVATSTAHTFSVYAKALGATRLGLYTQAFTTPLSNAGAIFDLSNGTVINNDSGFSSVIQDIGGGWYRCATTFTTDAVDTSGRVYICVLEETVTSFPGSSNAVNLDGTSSILIYGAQLEAGSTPSSYIPTSGATATRSADVASIPVSAFGYNKKAGTVVVEVQTPIASNDRVISFYDASNTRAFDIFSNNGTNLLNYTNFTGGGYATIAASQLSDGSFMKCFVAVKNNDFASGSEGSVGSTDTSITMDVVPVTVGIGGYPANSNQLNGHIKSIQYYPRRLTNTQLQELTS